MQLQQPASSSLSRRSTRAGGHHFSIFSSLLLDPTEASLLKWGDKRVGISVDVVPGSTGGVCLRMCEVGVCGCEVEVVFAHT